MARKKENHQWVRVRGTVDGMKVERTKKNDHTLKNEIFLQSCERVGIKPTRRQASKWNNKKGAAFKGNN
jgi:hypothetical protein